MREQDTDWFKRMQARVRETVRDDLTFVFVMIGGLVLICAGLCVFDLMR
jgi:hypothetical protein